MIVKELRAGSQDLYNLKITDKNNKTFIMMVGGNLDLYWVPENYKDTTSFVIDSQDEFLFNVLCQLFDAVRIKDDKYMPILQDNVITFISEEWKEEESNILKIIKEKERFVIDFIKNENEEEWSVPHRGCPICFCNSGSRVPHVESLFMRMFNYLAYNCDEIDLIK